MASGTTGGGKVRRETVRKAVSSLLKWKKSNLKRIEKPERSSEYDNFMYLMLTLKKIPQQGRTIPHRITLPHPIHHLEEDPSLPYSKFCLIIDDRPKPKPYSKLTSEAAEKKIKSEGVPIARVLKFSKIKSNFQSFESKRKLYDSHDVFFADKRVAPLLPDILGKPFFRKKRKVPVPVDLLRGSWKEQIESALSTSLLCLSSGTCSVVKVGNALMEDVDIVDNVMSAVDAVAEVVPKKWRGLRSFHLKFSNSLALPIYDACRIWN